MAKMLIAAVDNSGGFEQRDGETSAKGESKTPDLGSSFAQIEDVVPPDIGNFLSSNHIDATTIVSDQNSNNKHFDEDSVCADIDRWADSSLEDCSSINESRIKELEDEQQRLNDALINLSTHFARIQFRIQQIAQAPPEKRDDMLLELQEVASSGCTDLKQVKKHVLQSGNSEETSDQTAHIHIQKLIGNLRQHLEELEQFAYKNGQLPEGKLPLNEIYQRQKLVLEKVQEKMRLQITLEKADTSQFLEVVEQDIDRALEPIREREKLVGQLNTQIVDLERFVKVLQTEIGSSSPTNGKQDERQTFDDLKSVELNEQSDVCPLKLRIPFDEKKERRIMRRHPSFLSRIFSFDGAKKHFERNELKHTLQGNHYGDQRADLELVVHEVVATLKKHQIFSIERPERDQLPVEQLNEKAFECSQPESVVTVIRKRFCFALRALFEHGLRETVASTHVSTLSILGLGRISAAGRNNQLNSKYLRPELRKYDGFKISHLWDVIQLFQDLSRALEMRDAVIGNLSEAFKLDSIDGKTATSKQILLCTIENVINSHTRLKRSPDSMWKAFVSAALNRNRLPAWIRIIFRSEMVVKKCYHDWSYVARTGCEDIRSLLEGLHEFNFDLPVDLAVRPFEHIKEAF